MRRIIVSATGIRHPIATPSPPRRLPGPREGAIEGLLVLPRLGVGYRFGRMATTNSQFVLGPLFALLAFAGTAGAQSYRDFLLVRNRPQPHRSLFQVRAGYKAGIAESENQTTGLVDDDTLDGFVLWHTKNLFEKSNYAMDFYAGLDGIYLGLKDDFFAGKNSQSRIELFGRPKAFYREGYYVNDDYLTTGQYEGQDYGVKLGFAQQLDQGMLFEIGGFFRENKFETNGQTRNDFIIPDDHNEYGVSVVLEQNTLVLDRQLGIPRGGMLFTVAVENARNSSSSTMGFTSGYTSSLPSGFWRGDGHLEFYYPNGKSGVWEIQIDGGYYATDDRVRSYHAEHVQGHQWGDATLGYRFGSTSFILKPYAQLQYSKILQLTGVTSDKEFFYGGGLDISWIFNQNMALVGNYSYVNNPSRPWVALDNDNYGQHQFFIGMDVSFGSGYRN